MTLCPIAVVAGCRKCPVFKICPLKSAIGDMPSADAANPPASVVRKGKRRNSRKKT